MIKIHPLIVPLFGPFALQGYGIMLAIGVGLAYWAIQRDFKRLTIMSPSTCSQLFAWAIGIGIIGGRLLYLFEKGHTYANWYEMFFVWQGGLSILGAVALLSAYMPFVLWRMNIPLFPCLDIVALYSPLIHAFGRLGCLWAGCCFGCHTHLPWAIGYQGTTAEAPLGIALHPTQAYSSLIFFCLFGILIGLVKTRPILRSRPGLLLSIYLIGMSTERFFIDFLRDDRSFFVLHALSLHQLCALVVAGITVGILVIRRYTFWKHTLTS